MHPGQYDGDEQDENFEEYVEILAPVVDHFEIAVNDGRKYDHHENRFHKKVIHE